MNQPKQSPYLFCASLIGVPLLIIVSIMATLLSNSVFATTARWGLIALATALVCVWLWRSFSSSRSAEIAQGVAAIATVIALVVAARIYFLERKDKTGLTFDIVATRALAAAPSSRGGQRALADRLLLGIRFVITNRSARDVEVRCISLGLSRPSGNLPLTRNQAAYDEVKLNNIQEGIPYDRARSSDDNGARNILRCLEADIRRNPSVRPSELRPLFMWRPIRLEPNEVDDVYFEIELSCDIPFVRILGKLRVEPEDRYVYEAKALVPLREVCEGRAEGTPQSVAVDEAVGRQSEPAAIKSIGNQ